MVKSYSTTTTVDIVCCIPLISSSHPTRDSLGGTQLSLSSLAALLEAKLVDPNCHNATQDGALVSAWSFWRRVHGSSSEGQRSPQVWRGASGSPSCRHHSPRCSSSLLQQMAWWMWNLQQGQWQRLQHARWRRSPCKVRHWACRWLLRRFWPMGRMCWPQLTHCCIRGPTLPKRELEVSEAQLPLWGSCKGTVLTSRSRKKWSH